MIRSAYSKISIHYFWTRNKGCKKNKGFLIFIRVKSDIDKDTLLELREEISALQIQIQKVSVEIEELLR